MPTAYITVPRDEASRLAEALVEERLAACVNRVPCQSTYRWQGELHHDEETILLAKTTADGYQRLEERVQELHPHDVPCIERFEERAVHEPFDEWIEEEVA